MTLEHPVSVEAQYFVISEKSVTHSLLGPYPIPDSYPGPHTLRGESWFLRNGLDTVLELIQHNTNMLAIGGQNSLPVEIAKRAAEAYSINPDPDQHSKQEGKSEETLCSKKRHGSAEDLPYGDRRFDSAVAPWALDQTEDLYKSLREITRVVNLLAPNARIVLTQGTPDNEIVNLVNEVCAPLSARSPSINHQGYLLAQWVTGYRLSHQEWDTLFHQSVNERASRIGTGGAYHPEFRKAGERGG
ncbi:hypothetical protein ASPVEDRAFT_147526 [Aspergillus versicolor CBS 583.65]|uniref:Methyltransferase type 11 domain-containing protein n=1 Tax=Aspergillus versicolor CBS 583.65 TaxID=1036611 RepID=A0A1L9P9R3_ASPVE|nr:uncharacterized protein ASPVEDRAFT_147526 [Aspergillus versicolor CBS 583.65]OJI98279.1 hypothetical protein ASPVEDRAFT_147526 [Aspergillus versicolor CBS 583.65]